MARPPSREKNAASLALIKMRAKFGWTQTELAAKLGVAVQSVGRWESYGPPRGAALERLKAWAEEVGYVAVSDFQHALALEQGLHRPLWFKVESEEESHVSLAVLEVLRNPQWADLRSKLKRDLQPVLDAWAVGSDQRRLLEAVGAGACGSPTNIEIPKPKRKKKK